MRLRTNLPGIDKDAPTWTLDRLLCLKYTEFKRVNLAEGIIAYINVVPSEQTIGNELTAEFQVSATSGEKTFWAKTRYTLVPGKWTPMVWTKPSWIVGEDQSISYPSNIDSVYIMVWSNRNR